MPTSKRMSLARVLLVECNNMNKWVGTTMPYEMHVPPLGLMYLASSARAKLPGIEVRIVESSLSAPDDERFLSILREFQPDVVGLRSIAFFLEEMQRIARLTRANSDATLIAGGPIVKAYKERLFEEVPELEIAVQGEGEQALVELLSGARASAVAGVLYRDGDQVMESPERLQSAEIDSLPFPAYDLIDLDQYQQQLSYAYNHRRQGVLLTSRGCVYHCTYCFSHWKGIRLRSAANIFQEIAALYDRHLSPEFGRAREQPGGEHAHWMFTALVPATLPRDLFAERLRAQGVDSRPFFYPLSDMPPYRGARFELSPPIRELAARGITLPSSTFNFSAFAIGMRKPIEISFVM